MGRKVAKRRRASAASSAQSLTDKAYFYLEQMIVTLRLRPGSAVSETELSGQLGIGRTPIREALQRLARERLVVILPRRGIIVSEINVNSQLRLLEVRRVVERLVARSAARRASDETRQRIQRFYNRDADVVHPPVDVKCFQPRGGERTHYLTVGRLVPYKGFDLAVQACTATSRPLVVVGEGRELGRLRAMAGPTVTFDLEFALRSLEAALAEQRTAVARWRGALSELRTTVQGLKVLRVDAERNLLLVNGGVPGATGSVVLVRGSVKQKAGRK